MYSLRIILFPVIFLLAGQCFGQLNPEYQLVKGKKDETVTTMIKSLGITPTSTNSFGIPYDGLQFIPAGGNDYEMIFTPSPNITGQVDIIVEYYDLGIFPGFPSVRYSTYRHEIKPSLVEAFDEVVISGAPNVIIDALANDSNSDGTLSISEIAYVEGGFANIGSDGMIHFTFEADSPSAMISYVAEDENGVGDNGFVRVFNSAAAVEEEIAISLNNKEVIDFYVANPALALTNGPDFGSYETTDWISYQYIPNATYEGEDSIEFTDGNGTVCTFVINVVEKNLFSTFAIDDYVYTSVNETITFNVFDNDYRDDLTIIDFSPELTYLGNGDFSYTPDVDETGGNIFYYKIFSGLMFHETNIFLSIDDYKPVGGETHLFEVVSGNEFLIEHSAPLKGYYFEPLTDPVHGVVSIASAGDVFDSACNDAAYTLPESSILYLAEPGYEGDDAFEVNYCTPGGNCHIVKIDINVIPDDGNCVCIADCVWPGDFNADGMVNMKDLLSFGLNVGQSGEARDTLGSTTWSPFSSNNWEYLDQTLNTDLKYSDADGNGFITENDLAAFNKNYGKQSKLISKDVLAITETPLILSTTQTEVDSGEWLYLDVSLGNEDNPYIDFYALTFDFSIDEDLIDEESACFQLDDDSWISYDSPLVESFQQISPGNMSFGVSRITLDAVSGSGAIATFKFIVEEEINGFRDSDGKLILNLGLENAVGYNQKGQAVALSTNTVQVDLNLKNEKVNDLKIQTYPNPASDLITIESNKAMDFITITDMTGRQVDAFKSPKSPSFQHDISQLTDGIYFIKVVSGNESSVHKISHFSAN